MNDPRIMMSFRLPTSARDRISALMKQHGLTSQSELILMALDALDSVAPSQSLEQQLSGAIRRIEALEALAGAGQMVPKAPMVSTDDSPIGEKPEIVNDDQIDAATKSAAVALFESLRDQDSPWDSKNKAEKTAVLRQVRKLIVDQCGMPLGKNLTGNLSTHYLPSWKALAGAGIDD